MIASDQYVIGTSGYSFPDWVGNFYPEGTRPPDMFAYYARQFRAVEINYTFYGMPKAATLEKLEKQSPPGFLFWIKANQEITHHANLGVAPEFLEAMLPLIAAKKLGGILFQFPQSFHRTEANRSYMATAIDIFQTVPLAVEFRHNSWNEPKTFEGLRQRQVALVVPDVPEIPGLFRCEPMLTAPVGYLRLHSRQGGKWFTNKELRYDYDYSEQELKEIVQTWSALPAPAERVYAFFNNCHRGQAAANAVTLQHLLGQRK